jgi:hypothetical protein
VDEEYSDPTLLRYPETNEEICFAISGAKATTKGAMKKNSAPPGAVPAQVL